MIDLSKYDAYLIVDEAGIAIADDVPDQIKKELQEVNTAYFEMYSEDLIKANYKGGANYDSICRRIS